MPKEHHGTSTQSLWTPLSKLMLKKKKEKDVNLGQGGREMHMHMCTEEDLG